MSDLREQFEKEMGWYPASVYEKMEPRYKNGYIEWLENKLIAIDTINQADKIRKEYE